jgi:hypothetical protein
VYQSTIPKAALINHLFFGPPQGAPRYDIERFHRRMMEVIKEIYVKTDARPGSPYVS